MLVFFITGKDANELTNYRMLGDLLNYYEIRFSSGFYTIL